MSAGMGIGSDAHILSGVMFQFARQWSLFQPGAIKVGTLAGVLRQAEVSLEEFMQALRK